MQQHAFQKSEYWIRWFPDDIHYLTPVGKITAAEKTAWDEFYNVYQEQKNAGSVNGLYAQEPFKLSTETLEIFYRISPGRLTDDEIVRCTAYDKEALRLIQKEDLGVREALYWQDTENPAIKAAWISFAKQFGPARARQIAENMLEGNWDFDSGNESEEEPLDILINQGMPLPTLPEEISIYTIKNRKVQRLVENIRINRDDLLIAPMDLAGSHWMTDFKQAVEKGMGIIVSAPEKVLQIDQADWLTVVGVNTTADSRTVLEDILRRNSATGEAAILGQDSPTNNTEAEPTQYTGLETDAEVYLRKTRMKVPPESSPADPAADISNNTTDAHRLTRILKLAPDTMSEMDGADLSELTEADAMAALLWTPCTWFYRQLWGGFFNKKFPEMSRFMKQLKPGDFFVNHVRARGTLPVIRIGENPYGILPVISLPDWCKNLTRYAKISARDAEKICALIVELKDSFLDLAQTLPKVDLASDEEKYETLLEILRSAPIAKRIEVRAFNAEKPNDLSADPKYLDCLLVKDKAEKKEARKEARVDTPYRETAYLCDFSHINSNDFNPASFSIDKDSPLLKRILDYFLQLVFGEAKEVNTVFSPRGSDPQAPEIPGGLNLLAEAAGLLKRVHPDKLETLLMETLDLFSHRLDAWFTGLADSLLEECRAENTQPPPVGVYGWLEKPGKLDFKSVEPEFIQAPSVKQATTAAILRNASMHNGTPDDSGAFQINLSSEQIRKGVWYMEGLRQGHLPGELLGYRLERMIHEESRKLESPIKDTDIFFLRDKYPLILQDTSEETDESSGTLTVIDGEKFLTDEETDSKFNEKFKEIKGRLNQIKDAAADIAMCEVMDAHDNVARRGGWLDFLDGDSLPPQEKFIRSHPTGDVHGTKIFLPIPPPEHLEADASETNPRIIADPILAHFCESLLPDFESKEIVACLTHIDSGSTRQIIFLVQELNMHPIDFVIGGLEEIKLRIRYHLLSCWKENDPTDTTSVSSCNILGPFPDFEQSDELLNEVGIDLVPPAGSEDTLSIFNCIDKAKLIRNLIHQNRAVNSPGTVHPQDIPLVNREQLDQLDPGAGFELLVRRLKRIRDQLIGLIADTVEATGELKRRHLILQGLSRCRRCVQKIKEASAAEADGSDVDNIIKQLKTMINNLMDSDPDFRDLVGTTPIPAQIDGIASGDNNISDVIETLPAQISDLEKQFAVYIKNTAKGLVINANLPLLEISRFGLEKALTIFPQEPTVAASVKIIKLFDQIIASLIEKLHPLIFDSPQLQDYVHCLKVVYLNAGELNEILNLHQDDEADADEQLRNRLPLTAVQSQIIVKEPFQTANYFEPLLNSLLDNINVLAQSSTYYEDYRDEDYPDGKIAEVISLLQAATDKEGMVILTPYLLTGENGPNGQRSDWTLDFSQLATLTGPTYLQEYQKVRPAIDNLFKLFDVGGEIKVLEDKRCQRLDPEVESFKKQGNTNYLYLTPAIDSALPVKCLTFLLIDQWQEGIPNAQQSETTGVTLRYESPQAEAPNAVIIAVPPYKSDSDYWDTDLLANTLLETIELMQIRLVGSSEDISNHPLNSHFHIPALLFPAKGGKPLFPSREKLSRVPDFGAVSRYTLESKIMKNK
ncbi:MAG: hypothetical protein GY950_33045 [bacterium]|nr:hypothetical protein [bacterium]